jgi:prepilin-type N-terminal cleavage/methylation domain-containing protein
MITHAHTSLAADPRGFTLVETLVAIAIIMIAIVGPYYSVQQAITASAIARDQLIASSLAQEGAEYVYYVRDSNFLAGTSWLSGLDNCRTSSPYNHTYGCTVDPSQSAVAGCSSSGCPVLKLNTSDVYTYSGSYPATKFKRTVKIQTVTSTEVRVTVEVTWSTEHHSYTVDVVENLYNWL